MGICGAGMGGCFRSTRGTGAGLVSMAGAEGVIFVSMAICGIISTGPVTSSVCSTGSARPTGSAVLTKKERKIQVIKNIALTATVLELWASVDQPSIQSTDRGLDACDTKYIH